MSKWEIRANANLPEDLVSEIVRIYREAKSEDDAFWEGCGLTHRASKMSLSLTVWIRLTPVQRHIIMEQVGHVHDLRRGQYKCQQFILRCLNQESESFEDNNDETKRGEKP